MVAGCFGNLSFNLSAWCWRDCGIYGRPRLNAFQETPLLPSYVSLHACACFVLSIYKYIYITRDASLFRVRVGEGGRESRQRRCGMPVTAPYQYVYPVGYIKARINLHINSPE